MNMKRILPALLLLLLTLLLSACSANNKLLIAYPDGDKYSFGNTVIDDITAARIRVVDIQWTSGCVDVRFDPAETVTIEETCNRELLMSEQVHWFVDGSTLYIKDCASGSFTDHEMISFTKKNKALTVTLPEVEPASLIQMEWYQPPEKVDVTVMGAGDTILSTQMPGRKATGSANRMPVSRAVRRSWRRLLPRSRPTSSATR